MFMYPGRGACIKEFLEEFSPFGSFLGHVALHLLWTHLILWKLSYYNHKDIYKRKILTNIV